jgi:hypothetical protein
MAKEIIKPDLWLVAIDETDHLSDKAKNEAGKVWGLYIVDASVHTYICSYMPMLGLYHLGFVAKNDISDDLQFDLDSSCDPFDYFGRYVLNTDLKENVTADHVADFPGHDDQAEYDEWVSDIADYYRCNVTYPKNLWKELTA